MRKYSLDDKVRLFFLCPMILLRWWLYAGIIMVEHMNGYREVALLCGLLFVYYVYSTLKPAIRGRRLATTGAFAVVAHPFYALYFAVDVFMWFLGDLTAFFVITSFLFWAVLIWNAYLEEVLLLRRFGESARSYFSRTLSLHFILLRLNQRNQVEKN